MLSVSADARLPNLTHVKLLPDADTVRRPIDQVGEVAASTRAKCMSVRTVDHAGNKCHHADGLSCLVDSRGLVDVDVSCSALIECSKDGGIWKQPHDFAV